jgi:AhpD family alkylhydroperoxidase
MRIKLKADRDYAWFIKPFFWLQQRNYGQVLIPGKCWGRSPRLFAAVATLYGVINRKHSPIDPVLRSLVTVRVSQLNWCRFCVDINAMTLVKRAGSSAKVEALAQWRTSSLFDERERAVLDYAEAMTGLDGVSEAQFEAMRPWFDDDALVELTGLVAFQNMSAKFNAALDIPAQGFCQLPVQPDAEEQQEPQSQEEKPS